MNFLALGATSFERLWITVTGNSLSMVLSGLLGLLV